MGYSEAICSLNTGMNAKKADSKKPYFRVAQVRDALEAEALKPLTIKETDRSEASIAVMDIFRSDDQHGWRHGDKVRSILLNQGVGENEVVSLDNGAESAGIEKLSNLIWGEGDESFSKRLDAYIELSVSHVLSNTNGRMKGLLQSEDLNLQWVNQSQGSSRVEVYNLLANNTLDHDEEQETLSVLGRQLCREFQLEEDGGAENLKILNQKLIDRVDEVVDDSEHLKSLQDEHRELLDKLQERGTYFVTSAGNNADELRDLRRYGYIVPPDFDDDVTSVGSKLVVGARFTRGTEELEDDEMAFFSSLYPEVDVWLDGFNIPTVAGPSTGTSYAAPLALVEMNKLRGEHPETDFLTLESQMRERFGHLANYPE